MLPTRAYHPPEYILLRFALGLHMHSVSARIDDYYPESTKLDAVQTRSPDLHQLQLWLLNQSRSLCRKHLLQQERVRNVDRLQAPQR